jgi:hypothetical protein
MIQSNLSLKLIHVISGYPNKTAADRLRSYSSASAVDRTTIPPWDRNVHGIALKLAEQKD